MNSLSDVYLDRNIWPPLITLTIVYLVLGFINHNLILTEEFYFDNLYGQVENSRLDEVVTKTKSFSKFKIVWEPLAALLSVMGTTFCLNLGLMHLENKVKFGDVFRVVLISHLVFLVPNVVRTIFYINQNGFSLTEFNNYSFGSLSFLVTESDSYWLHYITRTFTIFEIIFCALLVVGIKKITGWDRELSIRLVLVSYGLGLLFWMTAHLYVMMVIFNRQ
jgi:hypothetical protein